jgi:DHA1 family bicyclomycin/chloramphenicol resistance-like MFS transporter
MGMFAYITCAPFVFIGQLGFSERAFGIIFGLNALGMVVLSQWNARLLSSHPPELLLRRGTQWQTLAGLLLLVCAATRSGGPAGVIVPLFLFLACQGLILPNTLALAMAPFRANAGSASALLGTLQYSMAAAVTALVGLLHAERPLPMAILMLTCAAAALALARVPAGGSSSAPACSTPS